MKLLLGSSKELNFKYNFIYVSLFVTKVFFFFVNTEHLDELKRINQRNVLRRHTEQFVGWFECKVGACIDL
jgi:hypothetical protein